MRRIVCMLLLAMSMAWLAGCDSGSGGATVPKGTIPLPQDPVPAGGGGKAPSAPGPSNSSQ